MSGVDGRRIAGAVETVDVAAATREQVLAVRGLTAAYDETPALTDVSLAIGTGEIICVIGESGGGKSTLLKAIHGLGGVRVLSGEICFLGEDILAMPPAARRGLLGSGIGFIPQNPAASFHPTRRLRAQLRETFAGQGMEYDEERVLSLFSKMGLSDGRELLAARSYEMSGGMNQRLAIATAMLLSPRLLMCDEVTSALDVKTAGLITDELLRIRRETGAAMLLVTHDMEVARKMADRTAVMERGRLVMPEGDSHISGLSGGGRDE